MNIKNSFRPYLQQERFPVLWLWWQMIFGGTLEKRELVKKFYSGQKKVLEIGCSVGNLSTAFSEYNDIDFLGIDIDERVIEKAKKRFKKLKNFYFQKTNLIDIKKSDKRFDFIIFGSILHHVDDKLSKELLSIASSILNDEGIIVISEPLPALSKDSWLMRFFSNTLEQGEWLRNLKELENLVRQISTLSISHSEETMINAFVLNWPKVTRYGNIVCKKK